MTTLSDMIFSIVPFGAWQSGLADIKESLPIDFPVELIKQSGLGCSSAAPGDGSHSPGRGPRRASDPHPRQLIQL